VVSTFTEKLWRPDKEQLPQGNYEDVYRQIRTLGPDKFPDSEEDRGVVHQFSFLTLDKAIRCAKAMRSNPGLEAFSECWEESEPRGQGPLARDWTPTVELLANGDSHIPLRLLDMDDW
jgi:hypothetical protein